MYVFLAFIFNQLFVYHRLLTLSYSIADADNPYVTRKSPLPTSRGRSRSRSRFNIIFVLVFVFFRFYEPVTHTSIADGGGGSEV